jgi:phosphoglycolate/pyridoxal phosphate phosphatase family enzyme
VTNNTQTTREEMLAKCTKLGYNLKLDSMVTAPYVTAHYLKQQNFNQKAYVIGPPQLGKELDDVGIEHFGIGADNLDCSIVEYVLKKFKLEENVGAVIVAFDSNFSYVKLCKAVNYLRDPNIRLIATNSDRYFDITQVNFVLPEVGCLINAIECGSGRIATVITKPSTYLCNVLAENEPAIDAKRALVIGDSLRTDMVFANTAGYETLLVGTGTSQLKDVQEVIERIEKGDDSQELKKMLPGYYVPSLNDFYKTLLE